MFEAPRLVAGLDDVAVVRDAIEQCRGHLLIMKDLRPFGEGEVRRDEHGDFLVEAIEQMEQEGAAGLAKGKVAQLIEHDEMHAGALPQSGASTVAALLGFEPVNEIEHGEEAPAPAVLDELVGDGDPKMSLAGARPADQD